MTRTLGITRRWLLAGAGAPLALPLLAQNLSLYLNGDRLHVAAPDLHFLKGEAVRRLHSGAPVAYAMQLTLSGDGHTTVSAREIQRFILSYDLWEERYSATRLGHPRRSASHLTGPALESWCLEQMSIPIGGISDSRQLWARLEVRAEAAVEHTGDEGSLSIARLVEMFSRRSDDERSRWSAGAGPFRLSEIPKTRPAGGK